MFVYDFTVCFIIVHHLMFNPIPVLVGIIAKFPPEREREREQMWSLSIVLIDVTFFF